MLRNINAVIIDSGRGTRHLDSTLSTPNSLQVVGTDRTVLDWAIHALKECGIQHITYIGGYNIQKIMQQYPELQYRFYARWQQENELAALLLTQLKDGDDYLFIRSNTVFVPEALKRLLDTDKEITIGNYFSEEKVRYFAGVVRIPAQIMRMAFDMALRCVGEKKQASIEDWLKALVESKSLISQVDINGLAAPLRDRAALVQTVFNGKGRTLEQIRPLLKSAVVLDQIRFNVNEWQNNPTNILKKTAKRFGNDKLIVRSSAYGEDSSDSSGAGYFCSIQSISALEKDELYKAIQQVLVSYKSKGRSLHERDEIFIQRQVIDISASGVLLTRDLETGAPYYVLNIDRTSGRPDLITSGANVSFDTIYISRNYESKRLPTDVAAVLELGKELQMLTHYDALDIEFGIDRKSTPHLFQVRPIVDSTHNFELSDEDLTEEIQRVKEFLDQKMKRHPNLYGSTTVFSTMADWNPIELLGHAPRPLALSLYQRLIGDRAWLESRILTGYMDIRPMPLIMSLGGCPYVDVRASLNSFLPSGLEPDIAEKWVEYGLNLLSTNSHLHDKLEFEVAITCLTFDFDSDIGRLRESGLTSKEISMFRARLLTFTNDILNDDVISTREQLILVNSLENRRKRILTHKVNDISGLAWQIHTLLADCERFGTVPFSIFARYAFIAIALLRSLNRIGVFSDAENELLLKSIPTVASDISRDINLYRSGLLTKDILIERYGHVRPSSYDITSPNYASSADTYFDRSGSVDNTNTYADSKVAKGIFDSHSAEIQRVLVENGFTCSYDKLRDFVINNIQLREKAKFEFMKNVNAVLESIAQIGKLTGFSREDMSFIPIELIERGATDSPTSAKNIEFHRKIKFLEKRWNLTCAIRLPHLVKSPEDVHMITIEEWSPNFITNKRVIAPAVVLGKGMPECNLDGKIVMIRAADPGYDWIFSHPVVGLITQYGGVASHMSIRAAEFGLPAAIGCGYKIFEQLSSANLIELDCTSKKVQVIS